MKLLSITDFSLKTDYKVVGLVIGCVAIFMKLRHTHFKDFISSDPKDYLILALSLLVAKNYYN